jgi:integrase
LRARTSESGALRTRTARRYKASSIDTARTQVKHLRAEFGERAPRSITRVEAEDWAARMPPSTLPMVVQFMNDLYRAELIDRNRFEALGRRLDSQTRERRRPPTEEEMLLLVDGCDALGDYAPMICALLTFAAYSLMRPGELIALAWDDVDLAIGRRVAAIHPWT